MLTPVGNVEGVKPVTFNYARDSWRSMSFDEAYRQINHKGGVWIGYGESNPGIRFKAPWCLEVKPGQKLPCFATPVYERGYDKNLDSVDNGLFCNTMESYNLNIKDFTGGSNQLIAATTNATLRTDQEGNLKVKSNKGIEWEINATPGNDLTNKIPIFKGGNVEFADRFFTYRGTDGFANPQGPVEQYASYMSGPTGYNGIGFENGNMFYVHTYCNAKISNVLGWLDCEGIVCKVNVLKGDANGDIDTQRFLQLSAIWDEHGRMTL